MKIAVITANYGGIDQVHEIVPQNVPFDRFYYTEANSPFPMHTIDNRLKAKVPKIIPHLIPELSEYDIFVWVDANVNIKSIDFLRKLITPVIHGASISISAHPVRKSIYEEAQFIINQVNSDQRYLTARYTADSIAKEIKHIGPGYEKSGLYYCGIFATKNNRHINNMRENWYLDNILFTNFDQLNFVSNVRAHNIKLATVEFGDFYHNEYYSLTKHLKVA